MSDQIVFKTEKQAIEFVRQFPKYKFTREQFPKYKFIREGRVVIGSFSALNLSGANLSGANLAGVDLQWSSLSSANLEGANLEGANLEGANLSNACFFGSNLINAKLKGANLKDAILDYANVSGTTILSVPIMGAWHTGNHLYASPVYDDNGKQVDWGYHEEGFYGSYEELRRKIIRSYGEGNYFKCLNMLKEICMMKFDPLENKEQ